MTTYIVSEIVSVKVNGQWYDAEIIDITSTGAYVYISDLRIKKNVSLNNIK